MTQEEAELPKRYYSDESDPDVVVLRRDNGTFLAAISARGATKEASSRLHDKITDRLLDSPGERPPRESRGSLGILPRL